MIKTRLLLIASLSLFFSLSARIMMPHWQIGHATAENLVADGGCKLAYQGAHYIYNKEFEEPLCILADGIGPTMPTNTGGIAAKRAIGLLRHCVDANSSLPRALSSVINALKKERLFAHAGTSLGAITASHEAITVATIGTTRAVLSRGGVAYPITFDHTVERPDEYDRICRSGGVVDYLDVPRVNGNVFSRAIGFSSQPRLVSNTPEVTTIPLSGHDQFIILACNGLWSVMGEQQAVDLVADAFSRGSTPDDAASALVAAARDGERGARDCSRSSVTAIVMQCMIRRNVALSSSLSVVDAASALVELSNNHWQAGSIALHPLVHGLLKLQRYEHQFLMPLPFAAHFVQQGFLDLFLPHVSREVLTQHYGLPRISGREVFSWVGRDAQTVNQAAAADGFSFNLPQGTHENGHYLATALSLPILWRSEGEQALLNTKDDSFEAVYMNEGQVYTYRVPGHEHPLFVLPTKNNDLVFMTKADRAEAGFLLLSVVNQLQRDARLSPDQYAGLVFPMIDYQGTHVIDWLKGMKIGEGRIEHVEQYELFKMNEQSSGTRGAVRADQSDDTRIYEMNEPFYCWVSRSGVRQPLFAAYCDASQWHNPGAIRDEVVMHDFQGPPHLKVL